MFNPLIEKTLSTGAKLAGTARILSNKHAGAQIPYKDQDVGVKHDSI